MERDRYRRIVRLLRHVEKHHPQDKRCTHTDATIVRVLLWAALHDQPTYWATDPAHWPGDLRPRPLPSQSCVSRRWRTQGVITLIDRLGTTIRDTLPAGTLKFIDGKPLPVGGCTKDPDAGFGKAAGIKQRGYRLISELDALSLRIERWIVVSTSVSEHAAALRLLDHMPPGQIVHGDRGFSHITLYEKADAVGVGWIAPAVRRGGREPKHASCPARYDADVLMTTSVGEQLRRWRNRHEHVHAQLNRHPIHLTHLPQHVRRHGRVQVWVALKIMIYHADLATGATAKTISHHAA